MPDPTRHPEGALTTRADYEMRTKPVDALQLMERSCLRADFLFFISTSNG